jgi:hypothetical protein
VLLEEQAFPFEEKATELHEVNAHARRGIYDEWCQEELRALRELRAVRYGKTTQRRSDRCDSLTVPPPLAPGAGRRLPRSRSTRSPGRARGRALASARHRHRAAEAARITGPSACRQARRSRLRQPGVPSAPTTTRCAPARPQDEPSAALSAPRARPTRLAARTPTSA